MMLLSKFKPCFKISIHKWRLYICKDARTFKIICQTINWCFAQYTIFSYQLPFKGEFHLWGITKYYNHCNWDKVYSTQSPCGRSLVLNLICFCLRNTHSIYLLLCKRFRRPSWRQKRILNIRCWRPFPNFLSYG